MPEIIAVNFRMAPAGLVTMMDMAEDVKLDMALHAGSVQRKSGDTKIRKSTVPKKLETAWRVLFHCFTKMVVLLF